MTQLDVETPAAVVDLDRLERNLARWQERCDELGLANRPHIKTHKCVEIARRQVELGAAGLTCQTLGEAEVMSEAGIRDLLVATNVVGERKLARLAGLLEAAALTVVADDAGLLPGLERAAERAGRELRVLVECDTGLHRTGVASPEDAVELAAAVATERLAEFAGFLTYPAPPAAVEFLSRAVERRAARGLEVETVSAGGTPAMWAADELRPTVTEYRVGTYAFHDRATVAAGAAGLEDVALTVCATVRQPSGARSGDPRRGLEGPVLRPLRRARARARARGALLTARAAERGARLRRAGRRATSSSSASRCTSSRTTHASVANLFERLTVVSDGVVRDTWTVERRR